MDGFLCWFGPVNSALPGKGGGVAEVAEGVRIFAIGFRKLQACPPALFGNGQRLRFSDSSVIAFLSCISDSLEFKFRADWNANAMRLERNDQELSWKTRKRQYSKESMRIWPVEFSTLQFQATDFDLFV